MTATTTTSTTASASATPTISVLMALHGRGDLAAVALRSFAATVEVPYEVIVVDNASSDESAEMVRAAVPDARIVASDLNLGFGAAVDLAALHAKGTYLLLLNSDVSFEPGWAEPLLDLLESRPTVAAVTPALMGTSGDVPVEVGSALHGGARTSAITDDQTWAHARPRAVPYASAACLLIRRAAFDEVGGLDAAYPRGYYEDVELATALRARGLSVFCEPRSKVAHVRGGSTNKERAIELVRHNREIFCARNPELVASLVSGEMRSGFRARDSAAIDRILVIDDRIPNVDRGSGDPRMSLLLTRAAHLLPEALITLLPSLGGDHGAYAAALAGAGVELVDWSGSSPESWLEGRFGHYSVVLVSRHTNAARLGPVLDATQPQAIRVVDVEAVIGVREHRWADVLAALGDPRADEVRERARRTTNREIDSWRRADVVVCVSPEEAELVRRDAPGTEVLIVSSAVTEPDAVVPRSARRGLAFFGGFMSGEDAPNADAVRYVADEVMPVIWRTAPDVHLDVVGNDPVPSVLARSGERIHVRGRVSDPVAALGRHLVVLAPQRSGSGIKLKFLDAMAAGTPFVTTPHGAEGLHLGDLTAVLVGRSTTELAEAALRLVHDEVLWQAVHVELRTIVRHHFGFDAFDRSVADLLAHLGAVVA